MIRDMAAIAAECVRRTGTHAVWAPELGRYVCPETDGVRDSKLELMTEVVRGLFDLAKVGFGAIVGLLGAKRLEASAGASDT